MSPPSPPDNPADVRLGGTWGPGQRRKNDLIFAASRAALAAVARGAAIVRVHDVRETVDALRVWHAVEG